MKKPILCVCSGIILFLIISSFPITTTYSVSGDVLTSDEEKLEYCDLSLEIKEVRSLLYCYKKFFTFVLDGNISPEPVSSTHHESDSGSCLISQMYYDEGENRVALCSLLYQNDLSYFVLHFGGKQYTLEITT